METILQPRSDLISTRYLNKSVVLSILQQAAHFKNATKEELANSRLLKGNIIANCFFEPSTRTRLSFESAALRLHAQVIGFSEATTTSMTKGETLEDTIQVVSHYADLLIIRHSENGALERAASASKKPVINAGDGTNEHPTQALIDLFTLWEVQPSLEGLSIAFVGDLKNSRTIHSLLYFCILFKMKCFLISPIELALPHQYEDELNKYGIQVIHASTLGEVIPQVDIIYMTRLQKERLNASTDIPQNLLEPFTLTLASLQAAKPNLQILHPLPRNIEIERSIDHTPYAYYFTQSNNGIYMRQAILSLLLGNH